jgi:hypothetical protein
MTAWDVSVYAVWDPTAISELALDEAIARFSTYFAESSGYYVVVDAFPHRCKVRFILSHEDPADAGFEGLDLFREALQKFDLPRPQQLDMTVEARTLNHKDPTDEDEETTIPPPIVGVTEAAGLLGITKQRLAQLTRRSDFPAPWRLAAGPFWLRSEIEGFQRRWPRRRGRSANKLMPRTYEP